MLNDDFRVRVTPESNWAMLGQHFIELLHVTSPSAFADIISLMIDQMRPYVMRDPFVAAAMAETGRTDDPGFQEMLEKMTLAAGGSGLIYFHSGFIGLGDHFSTLWALRLIALAGKTANYENVVRKAVSALEDDLDLVLSRSPDFVGFLLYVAQMLPEYTNPELIDRCIDTLLAGQAVDGWWYGNHDDPLRSLRGSGFVAYDLLHALDRRPSALHYVERWLCAAFDLGEQTPTALPEPFTWAQQNQHPDVWLQGWIRAVIAASLYLTRRRIEYSPVSSVTAQYVLTYRQLLQAAAREQRNQPFLLPEEHIMSHAPHLKEFFQDSRHDTSVFIMRRMGGDETMQSVMATITDVLNQDGLRGRYAEDRVPAYNPNLWINNVVYMRGCKYGIAVFERRMVEGTVPPGPNANVLVELGFMVGKGAEVLILYDESSMDALPQGPLLDLEEIRRLGLPTVIAGALRSPFRSDEAGLASLRSAVESWAKSIAQREGLTQE
jgi:hypothetical protein